ncbi:MAG: hypothetical protein SangKO_004340 [Sandaracinaceae bacterium]|nr:MAG: hypothetical protein EVA89_24590 [Sandaracinaceae bacterium]HBQ10540.1 hypothetical protein [Myxococcales bacterium]
MLAEGMSTHLRRSGFVRTSVLAMGALFALGAVLVSPGLLSRSGAQQAEGFSADERQRLADGRLVVRRSQRRRGQLRLIGGNSWQVVDQPVEVTWRAMCDEASYRRMLPAVESARVVSHAPGQRTVRFRHAMGFTSASYHLRMRYDHDRRDITFRLDRQRPNDLRAAWGFLSVAPFEDDEDRSLVSFGVMADPGGGMLGGLVRGEIHDWMLRVPETIRTYMHGSGGRAYASR